MSEKQIICHKCGNDLRLKKADGRVVEIQPCMECAEYFADMMQEPAEFKVLNQSGVEVFRIQCRRTDMGFSMLRELIAEAWGMEVITDNVKKSGEAE